MIFVNVTIVYGTIIKSNTYNCVQLLLNNLKFNINIEVKEFFLSKDFPYIYHEGFSNLANGNCQRHHFNYIDTVAKSLDKADLIILACPVSTCDITREMKSFSNYLSYGYMQNNKNSLRSTKIGLVMSTACGAGLFHTTRALKKSLNLWGVNNIFSFSETLYEMNWKDVSLKTNKKINKKISKLSNNISDLYNRSRTSETPIMSEITSSKIEPLFKNNHCNVINFSYWKKHSSFYVRN